MNPSFTVLDLTRSLIGFDRIFEEFEKTAHSLEHNTKYPPYNVSTQGNTILVELAVAGFTRQDIQVTVHSDKITVVGDIQPREGAQKREIIHQGISTRKFKKTFTLARDVVVDEVKLEDGILSITLTRTVPEVEKARQLEIK